MILLKAQYDWIHLRLEDFESVIEYNFTLFKISSRLKLRGENNELLLNKKTTSLAQPALHHSLKRMEPHLIIIEEITVVDVVVIEKINIERDVLKKIQRRISHLTTGSGIKMKQTRKWQRFTK